MPIQNVIFFIADTGYTSDMRPGIILFKRTILQMTSHKREDIRGIVTFEIEGMVFAPIRHLLLSML